VTGDALKAVIDHVGPGNIVTVTVDGASAYEITVKALATTQEPRNG